MSEGVEGLRYTPNSPLETAKRKSERRAV